MNHCSVCGYTKEDAQTHMDHDLCKNAGNAPWEKKAKPVEHSVEVYGSIGGRGAIVCSCGFVTTFSVVANLPKARARDFFDRRHQEHLARVTAQLATIERLSCALRSYREDHATVGCCEKMLGGIPTLNDNRCAICKLADAALSEWPELNLKR